MLALTSTAPLPVLVPVLVPVPVLMVVLMVVLVPAGILGCTASDETGIRPRDDKRWSTGGVTLHAASPASPVAHTQARTITIMASPPPQIAGTGSP